MKAQSGSARTRRLAQLSTAVAAWRAFTLSLHTGREEEKVMAFVQIIEFHTDKLDQIRSGGEVYEKDLAGKHKVRRRVVAEDRDHPGRYFLMAFFDSYEDAMQNSAMPETDALSKKLAALVDGPPSFSNLNIIEERQF
jgi:hypothetical protein